MTEKIEELRRVRIQKLEQLKNAGTDPYPVTAMRTHTVSQALELFSKQQSVNSKHVTLAGRIRSIRTHGKLTFATLEDESGSMQLLLREDVLGSTFRQFNELLDVGDFMASTGTLALSKTGEKSLETINYQLLTKSLRPIPQEHFGLKDLETRLRKRHLDLLVNPETRELFRKKAVFWQTVENFLIQEGFLQVWNPVLENIYGGADAEPFMTHHNALDRDFFMRISLELPLKRLLVGGYEKVFEIGRLFRNEGIDRDHLQEYDDVEFYWAYADHLQGMELLERLMKEIAKRVTGGTVTEFEGQKIHWGKQWPRVDYFETFEKETGMDLNGSTAVELLQYAQKHQLNVDKNTGKGRLIDVIFKKRVRPKLIQPCFLIGHPLETSPLAKQDPANPKKILRFQPMAGGTELGNCFAELNDPLEQRRRLEEQMRLKAAGDKEAHLMDEDFVEALEYGMPPAVGFGMSERFFAVLMNKSMRETVIFPPMRDPRSESTN